MHRSCRTTALSGGLLLFAVSLIVAGCSKDSTGPSAAERVRINITAEIALVSDPDGLLGGDFSVGDEITGYYIYDSTLEDENAIETVGDYRHATSPYGIFLTCNGFEFKTDLSDVDFLLEVVNDHGTTPIDNYVLVSYNNEPMSATRTISLITWQLDDDTAQALDSTEPGTDPPVLAYWDSVFGLNVNGEDTGGLGQTYLIRAHVIEATKAGG
ncbi:hypothetical protein ACFL4Y_00875 [Gemmatimonadota bacterium]